MHAWTQTARRAVLPGTLRESAAGPAGDPITTPPLSVRFPLPAATIASSFTLSKYLGISAQRTVPGQPAGRPDQSVSPHHPASGGPAADPNLQGLAYGAPAPGALAGCP